MCYIDVNLSKTLKGKSIIFNKSAAELKDLLKPRNGEKNPMRLMLLILLMLIMLLMSPEGHTATEILKKHLAAVK